MNFSSWNFLRNLRNEKKQFAVIGLGRFGSAVCSTLYKSGYEVLAIDQEEKRVISALSDHIASHALQLDSTETSALREAGIFEFDTVIVAVGSFLAESITTTLNLKEGGVPNVIAKASSETHVKLLNKVGADMVVFPEQEMGQQLARQLTRPRLLDQFELDAEHSIVEMIVPDEFDGKTIAELELRRRYGLNLLAIKNEGDKMEINPLSNRKLYKGTMIVVVGSNQDINRLVG
ncbi:MULTISPECIES: potassium channel family protein [Planktothrix]|uniref:Ktr system potassium uptake protein C n=2 Tax=Planktothrix TaxID=54304 RepID=A0A6J7ZGW6_PLARU|nr:MULTISPECIES: TrkA family potassium uptake protein [Planktothrix]CAD5967875.1 Ktr system potassium uptake protein C [Planktothrix rubescens]CAC5343101.1 Ktr system potassium uptake protein C [Planktothrix rubescens NIVA-CYA 18]CAD5976660.1 Ktr system potassium uptake protein C [Planktothrix rubescens NIVA-CYA 18]CAH2574735.1 Ktr system potassium uptake protein C [Planktothrix rubescens]GDZ95204.1 putative K+ channel [Planktothrix agardhii CCAP 1459/11A]